MASRRDRLPHCRGCSICERDAGQCLSAPVRVNWYSIHQLHRRSLGSGGRHRGRSRWPRGPAFVRPRSAQRPPVSSDRGHHDGGPTTCVVRARVLARSRRRWYPLTACLPLLAPDHTNSDNASGGMRYGHRPRAVQVFRTDQHRLSTHHRANTPRSCTAATSMS